jgi:hypothetical protein
MVQEVPLQTHQACDEPLLLTNVVPAGGVKVTVTPVAVPGPRLVTLTVYVKFVLVRTSVGLAVIGVFIRMSACASAVEAAMVVAATSTSSMTKTLLRLVIFIPSPFLRIDSFCTWMIGLFSLFPAGPDFIRVFIEGMRIDPLLTWDLLGAVAAFDRSFHSKPIVETER